MSATPRTDALRKTVSMGEAAFDEVLEAHAELEIELSKVQRERDLFLYGMCRLGGMTREQAERSALT